MLSHVSSSGDESPTPCPLKCSMIDVHRKAIKPPSSIMPDISVIGWCGIRRSSSGSSSAHPRHAHPMVMVCAVWQCSIWHDVYS